MGTDEAVLRWINGHHHPVLDAVLVPVSLLGEFGALWILVCLVMVVAGPPETRRYALLVGATMLVTDRLVLGWLGERYFVQRPYLALPDVRQIGFRWETSSFPSGHASCVWIAAILFGARYRRWLPWLVMFALLTCYSRPYVGMHYPSHVLAGALIGIASGLAGLGGWTWWLRRAVAMKR
ncbi:MAG: phosphatase PAP2 family protein [Armatimonadetes bacterium]|nr:phosphatase PAP2 family protein [Armatimonadota bacterium]